MSTDGDPGDRADLLADLAAARSEVAALREELARALAARDDFFDAAAHDLRSPLAAAALHVSSLLDPRSPAADDPVVRRKLAAVQRQIEVMTAMTARLADVTMLAARTMPLVLEETDLARLVRDAALRFEEQLNWVGAPLVVVAPHPVRIRADGLRLGQAVGHLIANAGKYGGGAAVLVEVRQRSSAADVVVADRGPGVPPALRERIFDKFDRGGRTTGPTGLGLGLWIARRIVEEHGGSLRVADTPGGGATFVMALPHG